MNSYYNSNFINHQWINRLILWPLSVTIMFSCSEPKEETEAPRRPNILLLVADDLGYADLGCYGGDIETPNIDLLASQGVRFSRFHTAPLCAPSRAMFLTGNDNHIAGMGIQSTEDSGLGYEGHLTDRIITIPALLKANGYHTYMAGKWHLGRDSSNIPPAKGFEHSYANLEGAGSHYNGVGFQAKDPITPYFEDGKPVVWNNEDYTTDLFTSKLIEYIDLDKDDDKPFFAFAAYTSPHWPLQVEEKYWKKYERRYNDGYEKLKERRLESLKAAGMIPENAVLPPNHERVTSWDSLTADQKKIEARKMELYAGMVDNLDENIGRLLNHLKEIGEYDNTLIVFMSDNGAAAEDFYFHPAFAPFLTEHFTDDYESMGQPNSFVSYGPQWAEAGSSPFRYFKGLTTEGGINTPMIIAGPGVEMKNVIHDEFVTLLDLAPTFYDVAQAEYPVQFEGHEVFPLKGNSMMPFVSQLADQIRGDDYVFALEHNSKAMVRKGNWKIVNITSPFEEEQFELYNLTEDLAELNNLKEEEPEKYQEMLTEWRKFTAEAFVQIPSPDF